ncbi:MAG: 2-succinylbenzoate--CoA ligase, partial [Sphaerospermopsis sp. SIO1G2]|nr:2-succinylbenzoate--CoA ligase [Sphaerospermopsis sp. SIO1G2]
MEQPLTILENLQNHPHHDWLIINDHQQDQKNEFYQIATELYLQLIDISKKTAPPKIILAERKPIRFLASFVAACAAKCPVFLCNPDWGEQEWEQVLNLVQPNLIWGFDNNYPLPITHYPLPFTNTIMIPTGGSSGKIKFTIHTWETLTASVAGFTEYFQLNTVNSFCTLPLYHVSGLMQFIRSFTTGGKLVISSLKTLDLISISHLNITDFFISLVPTQLQRLLESSELITWLSQFKTVLLGGAPAWPELLETARFHQIKLAPTYGMTETASQIATLKPEEFLQGKMNSGRTLPHAKITIDHSTSNIRIETKSLALGYYPDLWKTPHQLLVDDIGFLDQEEYLHIIGRSSNKIISGGENIYPEEIEAVIRQTNLV